MIAQIVILLGLFLIYMVTAMHAKSYAEYLTLKQKTIFTIGFDVYTKIMLTSVLVSILATALVLYVFYRVL